MVSPHLTVTEISISASHVVDLSASRYFKHSPCSRYSEYQAQGTTSLHCTTLLSSVSEYVEKKHCAGAGETKMSCERVFLRMTSHGAFCVRSLELTRLQRRNISRRQYLLVIYPKKRKERRKSSRHLRPTVMGPELFRVVMYRLISLCGRVECYIYKKLNVSCE